MDNKLIIKIISDPGHAWGSVSVKLLTRLNLLDDISNYSYMSSSRVYLEYHSDLNKLFIKLKENNIPYETTSTYSEKTFIRSLPNFCKSRLEAAANIRVGASTYIYNSDKQVYNLPTKIINIINGKIYLQSDTGIEFKPITFAKYLQSTEQIPKEEIDTTTITTEQGVPLLVFYDCTANARTVSIYDKRFFVTPRGQKIISYTIAEISQLDTSQEISFGNSTQWKMSANNVMDFKRWVYQKEKQAALCDAYYQKESEAQKTKIMRPKIK